MYMSAIRRLKTGWKGGLLFTVSLKCKEQIDNKILWYCSGKIFSYKKVSNT